ncbi:MAG: DUF5670 family protein [Candidatus Dormibacteria bacterium]
MLLGLAILLLVLWLLGAFTIHTGLIHILLIIGIVVLAVHFLRGRRGGRDVV